MVGCHPRIIVFDYPLPSLMPEFCYTPPFCPFFSRARLGVILCARRTHALRALCFPDTSWPSRFTVPPFVTYRIPRPTDGSKAAKRCSNPIARSPHKKQPLALGAEPSRFWVPREKREQKTEDLSCTRIQFI